MQTQPSRRSRKVAKIAALGLVLLVVAGAGFYAWNRLTLHPASATAPAPPVPSVPRLVQVTGFVTQTGGAPITMDISLNGLHSYVSILPYPGSGYPGKLYYQTYLENHHVYNVTINAVSKWGTGWCDAGKLTVDTQNATIWADVGC